MAKDKPDRTANPTVEDREAIPDWSVIAGLRDREVKVALIDDEGREMNPKRFDLQMIVAEAARIDQAVKIAKLNLATLKEAGWPLLAKANVKTVMVDGRRITKKDGSSSKLNKVKLAKLHGAKVLDWLKECTERKSYTTLLIGKVGNGGGDEDGGAGDDE